MSKVFEIAPDLRDKIRRRAARVFEKFDATGTAKAHRITEVSATVLKYRLNRSVVGGAELYSGPHVMVRRDKLGRVSVPTKVEA